MLQHSLCNEGYRFHYRKGPTGWQYTDFDFDDYVVSDKWDGCAMYTMPNSENIRHKAKVECAFGNEDRNGAVWYRNVMGNLNIDYDE